jgi:tRNA A-37 threonylcarbamoyl transferase component Bud32
MNAPESLESVIADYLQAVDAGQAPDREELQTRHPALANELRAFFADQDRLDRLAAPLKPPPDPDATGPPAAEPVTLAPGPPGAVAPGSPLGVVRYFGDYELRDEIARGGMGIVFKARQVSLNRVVALKMILAGQLASKADVRRFHTEAEAAANLDHPNIVPIFEVGEWEGQHYFSMGYVEGGSLADRLAAGPLLPRDAAALVRPVAEAVQFAHDRGVIHRDLKPSNVLIDAAGRPKVADFGLAKRVQKGDGPTATGDVVGTPAYMPPEQAGGNPALVGPLADVYSLGAVLYACLTGRPPFQAANPLDILMRVQTDEPVRPAKLNPAVPRDLDTVCLKCLEKKPEGRYRSARALADDLGRFLDGEPVVARPAGRLRRARSWLRKRPWAISGIVALVLLVVSCISYGLWAEIRQRGWKLLLLQAQMAQLARPTDHERVLALLKQAADIRPDQRLYEEALAVCADDLKGPRAIFPRAGAGDAPLPFVSWSSDRYLLAWDQSGRHLIVPGAEIDPATGRWSPIAVEGIGPALADPTGTTLATVSEGEVVLVNRATGRRRKIDRWVTGLWELRFAPDGRQLALAGSRKPGGDRQLELWDLTDDRPPVLVADSAASKWRFQFSGDGERLAWWHTESPAITVGQTSTGQTVASVPLPEGILGLADLALSPDGSEVVWAEDGLRISPFTRGAVCTVQSMATGAVVRRLPCTGSVFCRNLAYSPGGRFVVGSEWGGAQRRSSDWAEWPEWQSDPFERVLVWDAASGELVLWLPGHAFAEGAGSAGELAIVQGNSNGPPSKIELVRLAEMVGRVAEAGLGPCVRDPDYVPMLRLNPFGLMFGWPTLLAFLAFVTVNVSSLERYRRGRAMPPALARACAVAGGLAAGWALVRLLAVFDLPDWHWWEAGFAAFVTLVPMMLGMNAVWNGVRNLHSALRGDNSPVIRLKASMTDVDRAAGWGARLLAAVWLGWLMFVFTAGLDGVLTRFGLGGVLLFGGVAGIVLVPMFLVPLRLAAVRLVKRWPVLDFARLRTWLDRRAVALMLRAMVGLTAGGYAAVGVWQRVATRAWERLPPWHWGLEFHLPIRHEALGALAFSVAVVLFAVSLLGVQQNWRARKQCRASSVAPTAGDGGGAIYAGETGTDAGP